MRPVCLDCATNYVHLQWVHRISDRKKETCCICFEETDEGYYCEIPKHLLMVYQGFHEDGLNEYGEPFNPPDGDF